MNSFFQFAEASNYLIEVFLPLISVVVVSLFIFFRFLRSLREFIEANPRTESGSWVRSATIRILDRFSFGLFGKTFKEEFEKSETLKSEIASLNASVNSLEKRNSISLLAPDAVEPTSWQAPIVASRNRLLAEVDRLRARSTANLAFGVVLSLTAVGLFFFIIFYLDDAEENASLSNYVKDFIPKFTLAVMVQIIASFFLKMHVSCETEIKWTSNELTNLECRFTAMALSEAGMSETLVNELSKSERNFILGKDQKALRAFDEVSIESMMDVLRLLASQKS